MVKLSVVIITFNEEKQIGRCIDSVLGIADEVIVLDSFSTDTTEIICRQKGAIFHQHEFDGYIEQKNRALSIASFDFILSLDADEVLSDELRSSIGEVKQNPTASGFTMNRLNNYCGKWIRHGGWYPDKKLRLIDRRLGKWEGENPHDKLVISDNNIKHLTGDLFHYSYHSIHSHVQQSNNFSEISAASMYKKGIKAPLWKLVVNPSIMFIKCYITKAGFLDGYLGYTISRISSHSTFLKYAKLRFLWIHGKQDGR
ncbi:MAG: glycosyltransferase family 2 protein [Bacteroidetes bacterium]|nr:glycosyltransferase family 2 protein [Bacteroidota bacterium]